MSHALFDRLVENGSLPLSLIVAACLVALCLRLLFRRSSRRALSVGDRVRLGHAHLSAIDDVPFYCKPLLTESERAVCSVLHRIESASAGQIRLLAQVSLGQLVGVRRRSVSAERARGAFFAINSKRVDFVFVDASWNPLVVVEHQGRGHQADRSVSLRDEVKRRCLQSAGVPFVEIFDDEEREEIVRKLAPHLPVSRVADAAA